MQQAYTPSSGGAGNGFTEIGGEWAATARNNIRWISWCQVHLCVYATHFKIGLQQWEMLISCEYTWPFSD